MSRVPMADDNEDSPSGGPVCGKSSCRLSSKESFECCVCLDLIYKPVILACGHISCFWCVHRAMDGVMVSYCPLCRSPYQHFPAICQLLHNLLQKIEPSEYKRRKKETLEMESKQDCFSPQFVDNFAEGTLVEQSASSLIEKENDIAGENSKIERFDENDLDDNELGLKKESSWDLHITDALCAGCKQLLFQPVVLNCGHVYCRPCLSSLGTEAPRCQVCQTVHPGNLPKPCLQLSNFLEKKFQEEYAKRRQLFHDLQPCASEAEKHGVKDDEHSKVQSLRNVLRVHFHVGCDSCGMYPIVGKRYKCKDCKESIGFDLCETCYNTRSKLPARFNQQHTPDHTFVLDDTMMLGKYYTPALAHDFAGDLSGDSAENYVPDDRADDP